MTREEALKAIKEKITYYESDKRLKGAIETLIPELKENEDERIREELIGHCKDLVRMSQDDKVMLSIYEPWLAWLEKQKEMPTNEEMLRTLRAEYEKGVADTIAKYEQKKQKPVEWTELTWKDIVELEGIINNVHYDFSAGIGQESFGKEVLERFRSTKGIEYLDEAEQKYWQKEQKPAEWSKEDKDKLYQIIETLLADKAAARQENPKHYDVLCEAYDELISWLKSLRPQPHTVSIKDATKFGNLEYERGVKDGIQSEKSRQWKPSEEQMKQLKSAADLPEFGPMVTTQKQFPDLESLYEHLLRN